MRGKQLVVATLGLLATVSVSACFYGGPGYGYPGGGPVVVGDYDEGHVWHDRDWWVSNRRDWVSVHHHEWLDHH
ncbi:MAG TPA: hypothetical protein VEJ86_12395 [Candidatus Binataceae bacterium]|nr:hypothetical protein [Candidatus Binataceae bacterium]